MRSVLLCNDDGATSEGLSLLRQALWSRGYDVRAAAPVGNHSGCGSRISLSGWLARGSSPLDCLRVGLAKRRPDWVFAGVNDGANIGRNLLTSGTVCLAAYAAEEGIPAVAISQHRPLKPDAPDFTNCLIRLEQVLPRVFGYPPPAGTFYNINMPFGRRPFRGLIGCEERGEGGYISKVVSNGMGHQFETEWVAKSEPERLLDRGYAVLQLIQVFKPLALGGAEIGHAKGTV